MVEGLDRFAEHFAAYADQYVSIGGAACTLAMEDVGQSFRATKDLEIVLCMEALKPEFVAAFWDFVRGGAFTDSHPLPSFIRGQITGWPVLSR